MDLKKSKPTRDSYGEALVELGKRNPDVVVVEADISKSTRTGLFARAFPERFFNVGVAEQNGMLISAGMATCGKIPFMSTYAVFGTMRACEQVRTFIAYPRLNVKIALSHGGLTPGGDGVTHQGTEDMGTMRTIPNMCVIMPADDVATRRAVFAAADWAGPVYLRFTRDGVPAIYDDDDERFSIGKAIQLVDGDDLTLIAVGDMVSKALLAAERLLQNGRAARVLDMHTIKPLDTEAVQRAAEDTGAIVTVEDHNIMNGLGSAVAEYLVENCPIPMQRIGLPDTFGESGPYEELLEKYGMATDHIVDAARKVLSAKRRGRRRG